MLSCSYCNKQSESKEMYIKHLKYYPMLSNGDKIKCFKVCLITYHFYLIRLKVNAFDIGKQDDFKRCLLK
jgi:hypothetical protein